ncbi:MAG: hypothetical protein ACK5SP_00110 [bacterium]
MIKKQTEEKDEPKDFLFPTELVEQVYEISGGADSYKGVILCVCSPKGTPQIYTRFDSIITSLGMKAALDQWLSDEQDKVMATDNE